MAEGNNHVTVAIFMHFLRADTKWAQQPPERSAWSGHDLVSRGPANGHKNNFPTHAELSSWMRNCGLYLVLYGIPDDRDALRSSSNVVGSPPVSSRWISSRDTVHNVSPRLRRKPATRHISSTKLSRHGSRTGARGEPK